MQITETFELTVTCDGIAFCEREAEVTISLEDDGCGDLAWHVERVEVENLAGTGWLRWDYKDTRGDGFRAKLGGAFFAAALSDPLIDEFAANQWRDAMQEAA
ncbi:hypothetical protein B0E33_01460 [Roseibium algicola]|uniref:Uncharacterized protein n=1 Tax=Roseibium algicola TaxID=2857014 RepID=A0ABN4WT64_9HYPH|nr:hypothetical protein [Roseibium aggregatum]AQQ02423.1 hypothetical protein B0E33_01460 [Roseibium aggregatum]